MPIIKAVRLAIAELFSGAVAAWLAAAVLTPLAFQVRGYAAVGGEGLLILLAGLAGCYLCHRLIMRCEEVKRENQDFAKRPGK